MERERYPSFRTGVSALCASTSDYGLNGAPFESLTALREIEGQRLNDLNDLNVFIRNHEET